METPPAPFPEALAMTNEPFFPTASAVRSFFAAARIAAVPFHLATSSFEQRETRSLYSGYSKCIARSLARVMAPGHFGRSLMRAAERSPRAPTTEPMFARLSADWVADR